MAGGTVHLLVLPNATRFHTDMKKMTEKKYGPVEISVDVDKASWQAFKEKVENEDLTAKVKLKVDEDDSLSKALKDLEDGEKDIVKRLSIDTTKAKDDLKRFEMDTESDPITKHVIVDHSYGDRGMKDFRDKWDDQPIIQKIALEIDDADKIRKDIFSRRQRTKGEEDLLGQAYRRQKEQGREISGIINRVPKPSEYIDSLNFIPRLMKSMNSQFDLGIKQIYDGYIRTLGKMYKASAKPFLNLREDWNNAKTFGEFFGNMGDRVEQTKATIKRFAKSAKFEFTNLSSGLKATWKDVAAIPGKVKSEFSKLGASLSRFRLPFMNTQDMTKLKKSFSDFVAQIPKAGRALKAFGAGVASKIKTSISSAFGTVKKAWSAFINNDFVVGVTGFIKDIGSGIAGAVSFVGSKIKALGEVTGINALGRKIRDGVVGALTFVGAKLQAFGKAIGPLLILGMGKLTRYSAHLRKHLIAPFARFGTGVLRAVGAPLGKLGRMLGRSRLLFAGVNKMLSRVGHVAMGASRVAIGAFAKMAGFLMKSLGPAIIAVVAGLMAMGGQAVLGAIMALGGALMSVLHGGLIMMPAIIGAAGASIAVLKMGLSGLGDGIQQAFQIEDAAAFEEFIAGLPPAVADISRALRAFKPEVDAMKEAVQQNMLGGLDDDVSNAMSALLPIFSAGAQEIALSWNKAFESALGALSSPEAIAGTEAIMEGANEMAKEMEPFLANLIKAFGSLAEQGAKFLGPLGRYLTEQSQAFYEWAESLKQIDPTTGQSLFDGIIEDAKRNAGYLSDIFGGAFGTLGNVFKAGSEGGGGMLSGMADAMQRLKEHTSEGSKGFEQMVHFMSVATGFGSQLSEAIAPAFSAVMNIMSSLAQLASNAMPGVTDLFEAIEGGLTGLEPVAALIGENLGEIFTALAPIIESLLVTLLPILAGIGEGLSAALTPALEALAPVFTQLEALAVPLGALFKVVGMALGEIFVAAVPLIGSVLTILEPLIPIFAKVFYWIGQVVAKFLELITPIFTLRDEAVAGLISQLGPLVDVLGAGLMGVLTELEPLFVIIGELFGTLLSAAEPLIPIVTMIAKEVFTALIGVIQAIMPIIPPLASLIGDLANKLSDVLVVALTWVLTTFQRVWPAISNIIQFAVNNVIVPLIHILGAVFRTLADIIKWAIEWIIIPILNVLRGAFEGVMNFLSWVIDNVAQPAINRMKDAFQSGIDGIKSIWEGLKKIFANPIKFFIETVINGGIVEGWNKVMGWLNMDDKKWSKLNVPGELNFHSGGVLPGHNSYGKDNYEFVDPKRGIKLGLAGGEGIMRQEFVSAVGGPRGIAKLNEDARHGRIKPYTGAGERGAKRDEIGLSQGGVLNFAKGGTLPMNPGVQITSDIQRAMIAAVSGAFPNIIVTSGTRYHDVGSGFDNHMAQRAVDFQASGALAQWIANTYPNSAELFWDPGPNIKNGAPTGAIGGHSDHVHWAMHSMPDPYTGDIISQGTGGGGGLMDIGKMVVDWIADKVIDPIIKPIKDGFASKLAEFGEYGHMAVGAAKMGIEHMVESVTEFAKKHNPFGGSGAVGASGPLGSPKDVEMYRAGIIDAFKRQGEDPLDWRVDALLRQIWTESKGDPNIAQQIVDVNGTGESAGVGLYQVIPSTFAAYRDPSLPNDRRNVEAAHNFAVRYFRDRHKWNTGPGGVGLPGTGWKDGGVLPDFFDQGGVANGVGSLLKNTIQPERVLSPAQTRAFNDFVYEFLPELIQEFRNNPREFQKHFGTLTTEIKRIHKELRDGHIARLQHGMADELRRKLNGENLANNPVDLNFDPDWLKRNQENLIENAERASRRIGDAMVDPDAYLQAEKQAREQVDKEREEAREAEKEEEKKRADEAKEKAKEDVQDLERDRKRLQDKLEKAEGAKKGELEAQISEIDKKIDETNKAVGTDYDNKLAQIDAEKKRAREEASKDLEAEKEKLKKEKEEALKGVKDDGQKDAIKESYEDKMDAIDDRIRDLHRGVDKKFDEQKEEVNKAKKAEDDRQREIEKEEEKRIEEAKADGSYYYGYKVFDEEGKPTDEVEMTKEEEGFRGFMDSAGSRVGLGDTISGIMSRVDTIRQIDQASKTAFPAWMAALNGDPSGLAYNIAAGQSQVVKMGLEGAADVGPEAMAGIMEMAISGRTANQGAPFIGEVNSGMTQAELMQTLEHYETMRSRRGTGTSRVR